MSYDLVIKNGTVVDGTGAARYTSFTNGRSPIWNRLGHERMGWAISVYNPATP